jgi:hypothetical protein
MAKASPAGVLRPLHTPFIREIGWKLECNTGSVGLPLDGDPRAAWVMVEELPDEEPALTVRRVQYDITRIRRINDQTPDYPDFRMAGYQEAYKKVLATGAH